MKANTRFTIGKLGARKEKGRCKRHDAFTLVELLVVIGIVLALCTLLMVLGPQAVDRAKQVKCMGNLRSFGTGLFSYLGDHNNTFPKWTNNASKPTFQKWLREGKYIEQELRCPLIRKSELKDANAAFRYTGNGGMLQHLPNISTIPGNRARIVFASELYHGENGFTSPTHFSMTIWGVSDLYASKPNKDELEGSSRRPQYHGSKIRRGLNLLMLDGHIECVVAKDNDWYMAASKGGVMGDKTSGYIFYVDSFRLMKQGDLIPN